MHAEALVHQIFPHSARARAETLARSGKLVWRTPHEARWIGNNIVKTQPANRVSMYGNTILCVAVVV